ncbi:MAG: acetylornithine transaminase [Betaproteobacteria bacterium]|nr:acetylornithine transaminase [Betaproteobacteria bacterium]
MNECELQSLMEITARPPQVFVRGAGSYLWDHEGRRYLDYVQGWAVNCLGHSPKVITDAISQQAATLINPSPAYYNDAAARLATALTESSCFDRVFFASSGAEANEGAIKLARKFGAKFRKGAYEIITLEGSFHGRTLATMSASGKKAFEVLFEPKVPGFPKAILNDISSVKSLITDKTVAVMLEPVQGEAGVLPATDDFMRELRTLTQERGLLLIADEIQTGFGRTGKLYAYEHSGIEPDIMTLGKGIGGGVPLAALLATEQAACFEHGDQGGTYCGNPLMAAVGSAVLNEVGKAQFLKETTALGNYFTEQLKQLSAALGLGSVRGRGLLLALELGRDIGSDVVSRARDLGLLINSPRPATLRFMPALNLTRGEIDEGITILKRALG